MGVATAVVDHFALVAVDAVGGETVTLSCLASSQDAEVSERSAYYLVEVGSVTHLP